MVMKINFEADVKGFQRVEQALTTQKKLIDESAEAMKRFQDAKNGGSTGKNDDDSKHNDSLRVTSKRIEELTGALGTLTKSQSGLKSFMDLFSGFGKQLGDFNKTAATQVLESMTKQIDILKGSITSAGATLKNLQTEIKQAHAAGRTEEASEKESEAASLGVKMMGENAMLKNLQVSKFMNQPRFGEGGPSIAGMMTGAGTAYAGLYAGATAVGMVADKFLNYQYSGERSDKSVYERELSVAQNAAQGNIGRQFMLNKGIGNEAGLRKGTTVRGEDDAIISGDLTVTSFAERMRMSARHFKGMLTGDFKTNRELLEERGVELSQLDSKSMEGLNRAGVMMNRLIRNPAYDSLARKGRSESGIRSILESNARSGISQQESLSGLGDMSAYGATRALDAIERNKTTGDGAYDPRSIFSAARKLGLSDNAVSELSRQSYYNPKSATVGVGQALTTAGNRSIAADRILGDFGTSITQKNETGGTNFNEVTSVATDTMARLNQPANFVDKNPQPQLDAMAAARAGAQASQYNNDRIGTPGSLASIAQAQALNSLGIRNPIAVQQIQQLIAEGQLKKSVDLIHDITGKDKKNVMETINSAAGSQMRFGKALVEGDAESQRISGIMKQNGMPGLTESAMGGGIDKTLSKGLAAQDQQHLVFTEEQMGEIQSGKVTPTTIKGPKQTSLDVVTAAESKVDKELLDTAKSIAEAVGDKTGQMIVQQIAQGYIELGQKIRESADKVTNQLNPTVKQQTPQDKVFEGLKSSPGF